MAGLRAQVAENITTAVCQGIRDMGKEAVGSPEELSQPVRWRRGLSIHPNWSSGSAKIRREHSTLGSSLGRDREARPCQAQSQLVFHIYALSRAARCGR